MTIRVVVGEGGGGSGPPIRVRLVHDSLDVSPQLVDSNASDVDTDTETVIAPATPDNAAMPPEEDTPEKVPELPELIDAPPLTQSAPALVANPPLEPDAAPTDLAGQIHNDSEAAVVEPASEPPAPEHEHDPPPTETAADAASVVSTEPTTTTEPTDGIPSAAAQPVPTAVAASDANSSMPPPTQTGPPAGARQLSGRYALRGEPGRLGLVLLQGGSSETEAAVAAALAWLARAQSEDGRWDANRYGAGQEQVVLDQNRGGAGRNADTGVSALALLAFLAAGHSHQQGDYQAKVGRGLDFLIQSQAADGNLYGQSTFFAQMYCHSMSTFALAEAHAMTGDVRLKPTLDKAVQYCLSAQNAATGGWRYRASYDPGDTSQLGWQMMALASAERANIDVPEHTWTRVGRFLRSVRRGQHGGLASYRPDGPPSTSMTAEALYCQLLLREVTGAMLDENAAREATARIVNERPGTSQMNLYYWYYASLALHARQQADAHALQAWQRWNEALTTALLNTQLTEGPNAGSWDSGTVWGGYGGRVYTTAMAAMCLEVYYRYAPTAQTRWIAGRPMGQNQPR